MSVQKKSGFGTSFYRDLSRIKKNTEMMSREIQQMNKTLKTYFTEEGGFLFNRSAAQSLCNFVKADLASGQAFHNGRFKIFRPLSNHWKKEKNRRNFIAQEGRATDLLLNSITWHRSGYSQYTVGVKDGITAPEKFGGKPTGSIRDVQTYGWLLEAGHDGGSPPGSYKTGPQPARPWFGVTFHRWARQNLPSLINQTFMQNLRQNMVQLVTKGAKGKVDLNAEYIASSMIVSDQEARSATQDSLFGERLRQALVGAGGFDTVFEPKEERPVAPVTEDMSGVRHEAPRGKYSIDAHGNHIVETLDSITGEIKSQWMFHHDDNLWYTVDRYYQRMGIQLPPRD